MSEPMRVQWHTPRNGGRVVVQLTQIIEKYLDSKGKWNGIKIEVCDHDLVERMKESMKKCANPEEHWRFTK